MQDKLPLPPEREPIEREIADLFSNGDFATIARLLQVQQSAVSRAFSTTDDTRTNPVFQLINHLWAFDQLRDGLGDEVLAIVERERAKWRELGSKGRRQKCPTVLSGNVGREFVEAMEAELSGLDYNEIIAQWHDVEMAARTKKEHVIDQRNDYYENGNLRAFAGKAVNGRK